MSKQILIEMLGPYKLTQIEIAMLIAFFTCIAEQMEPDTGPYGDQVLSLQDGALMYLPYSLKSNMEELLEKLKTKKQSPNTNS